MSKVANTCKTARCLDLMIGLKYLSPLLAKLPKNIPSPSHKVPITSAMQVPLRAWSSLYLSLAMEGGVPDWSFLTTELVLFYYLFILSTSLQSFYKTPGLADWCAVTGERQHRAAQGDLVSEANVESANRINEYLHHRGILHHLICSK